jgi:hypothetical protein
MFKAQVGGGIANGLRIQGANTSGNTTVDSNPNTHDGSGGVVLRDLCLEGGYVATEGDFHGLVIRNAVKAENLYIKSWQGEGVKAWAGNVSAVNYGGNVSTTLLVGVKTEGCRGGIDIRGSDANVVTTINCEGYQNRWFGLLDDNGAGSNTHIGFHAASNGLITGTGVYTQCSSGGNRYAAKWGGDFTVAPSGTTADTANWLYIEAGAAVANQIPAHAATVGLFRAGGDYLTINSAGASIINCYSEGGGFSQFAAGTLVTDGTIGNQYYRGGHRIAPNADGLRYRQTGNGGAFFNLDHGGTDAGVFARDLAALCYGYVDFIKGNGTYLLAPVTNGFGFRVGTFASSVTPVVIDTAGLGVASGSLGYRAGVGGAVTQITSRTTSFPRSTRCAASLRWFPPLAPQPGKLRPSRTQRLLQPM